MSSTRRSNGSRGATRSGCWSRSAASRRRSMKGSATVPRPKMRLGAQRTEYPVNAGRFRGSIHGARSSLRPHHLYRELDWNTQAVKRAHSALGEFKLALTTAILFRSNCHVNIDKCLFNAGDLSERNRLALELRSNLVDDRSEICRVFIHMQGPEADSRVVLRSCWGSSALTLGLRHRGLQPESSGDHSWDQSISPQIESDTDLQCSVCHFSRVVQGCP